MKNTACRLLSLSPQCSLAKAVLAAGIPLMLGSVELPAADFVLDPAQSRLALSGTIDYRLAPIYGGLSDTAPLEEQGPGSLDTGYTGTPQVELTDSTITFTGGSVLLAQVSGAWRPGEDGSSLGTDANYGAHGETAVANFDLAVRNLSLDLLSSTLPLSGGTFSASEVGLCVLTNAPAWADYRYTFFSLPFTGRTPLSGILSNQAPSVATLTEVDDVQTLTLPVEVAIMAPYMGDAGTVTLDAILAGRLVATRTNTVPYRILSISATGETVTLEWETRPGLAYSVEQTTDFLNWTSAATGLEALGDTLTWSTNRLHATEFFRIAR